MARSSVLRLGAEFRARFEDLLQSGATLDAITDELNTALEAAGRPDRVSRSAVGRASLSLSAMLEAKRRADLVVSAMAEAGPLAAGMEGRLEVVRTLLADCSIRMASGDDPPTPGELKDVAGALLSIERAGHLSDQRAAAARERERAASAGERAARRAGLSASGAAQIRAAIEGAEA